MLNKPKGTRHASLGSLLIAWSFALLLITMLPSRAFAHRVYVYAWVEGDRVFTESYFSSGERVRHGQILVFGPGGQKLLEGRTNEKGEFSFPIPQRTRLRIVLNAAMGHKGQYILRAEDLGGKTPGHGKRADTSEGKKPQNSPVVGGLSRSEIKTIVEEALDERLRPIARSVALLREQKGPGITEVIGGIGYIIGLVGIALYFKNKGKDQSNTRC